MKKQEIIEDLRNQILDEAYEQGQALGERELCERYGISRTPMREILWKIASDGIIEQKPSRGFYVRKLEWDNIFEIYQAREAIEGMAVRLACQRAEEPFIKKIRELKGELESLDVHTHPEEGSYLGRTLHSEISRGSKNRVLADFYEKIRLLAKLTSNISVKSNSIEDESKNYHLSIMDAILEGDAEKSEHLMRDHLRVTCRNIIEKFYPQVFANSMSINMNDSNH